MGFGQFNIPYDADGFRLCVIRREKGGDERLDITETIIFTRGAVAVDIILRRAAICGKIGEYGSSIRDDQNHWVDLMQANGDGLDVLPMSREAWNYLKRKTKARIWRLKPEATS